MNQIKVVSSEKQAAYSKVAEPQLLDLIPETKQWNLVPGLKGKVLHSAVYFVTADGYKLSPLFLLVVGPLLGLHLTMCIDSGNHLIPC